jgi:uncharacterized Fe-S center protein
MHAPFKRGDRVGIKLHWGERGNHTHLPPSYAREIAAWIAEQGAKPFVFDTTVLYSGGRRTGKDSLETAAKHGFTPEYLGCEVVISDGLDGRAVVDLPCPYPHFKSVQVGDVFNRADGYVIFSHFKAHLASGFGGAIKNLSMGFGSRAQKQRMHADAKPRLNKTQCTRCGVCAEVCPTGAAVMGEDGDGYPVYDLKQCIGCAQCIAMCADLALRISFNSDETVFQEKLVETAAAVWKRIEGKSVLVNALLNIASECDCMPGKLDIIADDIGFLGGYEPVGLDQESVRRLGEKIIDATHPGVPWRRQFEYAREIGFPGA